MTVTVQPKALTDYKARDFRMLIDGAWVETDGGKTLERVAPGHGVTVSRYQAGTKGDAERAIAAARRSFDEGRWPRMTGAERSNILLKAADLIAARADELAHLDAIESGKPISQAKAELGGAVDIWRYAAALGALFGDLEQAGGQATVSCTPMLPRVALE